jgi:hypothetical protein
MLTYWLWDAPEERDLGMNAVANTYNAPSQLTALLTGKPKSFLDKKSEQLTSIATSPARKANRTVLF